VSGMDNDLREQAAALECLLPKLMRTLFTLEPGHPVSELPLAQLRVCTILQAGPRTMSSISEELRISVSAITQIADRLEKSGLVERLTEADDRRMRRLQLTVSGAELMRARRQTRIERAAQALEALPAEVREKVIAGLEALVEASRVTAPHLDKELV
jgi:DNA-binding MarR family transcriptional regulator